MKRILAVIFAMSILLSACATKEPTSTWQEQYDAGMRYLSEEKYDEAVIALTKAIEIDAKNVDAYVGRARAYAAMQSNVNLRLAIQDYLTVIELDGSRPEPYLSIADIYVGFGEYEQAIDILRQGIERTDNDQRLLDKLAEIEDFKARNAVLSAEDLTSDELRELAQENSGIVGDIPPFFGVDITAVGSIFGFEEESFIHSSTQSGYLNGREYSLAIDSCDYYYMDGSDGLYVSATAPQGSTSAFSVSVSTEFGLPSSKAVGWRGIALGDSFETVIAKLGYNPVFAQFGSVDFIIGGGEGEHFSTASKEPLATYNGVPVPQIHIMFHSESLLENGRYMIPTNAGRSVTFEFANGTNLSRVIFEDGEYLDSLI